MIARVVADHLLGILLPHEARQLFVRRYCGSQAERDARGKKFARDGVEIERRQYKPEDILVVVGSGITSGTARARMCPHLTQVIEALAHKVCVTFVDEAGTSRLSPFDDAWQLDTFGLAVRSSEGTKWTRVDSDTSVRQVAEALRLSWNCSGRAVEGGTALGPRPQVQQLIKQIKNLGDADRSKLEAKIRERVRTLGNGELQFCAMRAKKLVQCARTRVFAQADVAATMNILAKQLAILRNGGRYSGFACRTVDFPPGQVPFGSKRFGFAHDDINDSNNNDNNNKLGGLEPTQDSR